MILHQARDRFRFRRIAYGAVLSFAAVCMACDGERLVSLDPTQAGRTVKAAVGDILSITLQWVGPGEFASPPAISSAAVTFLEAVDVGPYVPAGPTQQFRFRATAPGTAIITFASNSADSNREHTVQDTVLVR